MLKMRKSWKKSVAGEYYLLKKNDAIYFEILFKNHTNKKSVVNYVKRWKKKNTHQLRNLFWVKLSFKRKGGKKTFSDKLKTMEFVASGRVLQEMLK